MAESLGEAVLDLRTSNKPLDRGIDDAKRKSEGLDKTFTRIGKNLSGFGDKMTTRVTLPLVAVGAAAFKLASDAQESANKFEIVMGGAADRTRASLKALEATIPLTTGEMLGLAAGTQDLLVPMGLARDAGADMSVRFVELAGDLSAFNNVPVAQVLADIKSGLVGSSEPLFKYGVDTRVAALEAVALANGLIEQGEALTDTTRAQAVLLQIQAQSTDAIGAAAREADGAAQSTQFLWREIKALGEEIGTVLIPILVPMINGLRDVVTWFRELSPTTQTWVVRIGLLVAAIGPLLSIVGRLMSVGGKIAGMMITNTAATTANTAANTANAASVGASGLSKALGTATLALGAFWAGWQAGEFLADMLGIQENAVANWWDGIREAFGAESVADIRASADAVAQTFGTYKTQAELAAIETQKLADAQANQLAPAINTVNTAATAAVDPATQYAAAIAALGIETQKDLDQQLQNLALAIGSGEVPAATMRPLLEEYRAKLEALGRLNPEVGRTIDQLTEDINEQDAAVDGIVGKMPEATDATNLFGQAMGALGPVVVASGDSIEDAMTRMALASDSNAFALAEVIAQQQGLTTEQGLALTAYRDNEKKVLELAEKLRGEWGPAIQESTEKMLALDETTRTATDGLGGFFAGFETGIPFIDNFLGQADGIIGAFGGILDGILGGGKDGGGIGSTISGFFGKITGGLKDGAGGLFDSIQGIFGGGGGEGEGGGIPGIFASLGGGSGEGFLGGLGSILGGGGEGGGIGGFLSGIFGGGGGGGGGPLGGLLSGIMGGIGGAAGGGLIGGIKGVVGVAANFIPVIGPFISAFAGPLVDGIAKLGGMIGGAFKKLFGGPSGAELEARKTANALNDVFSEMVGSGTRAAEGLTETWQVNNVAQRDMILALGGTVADVEATWDRFKNAAKDPAIATEMDAFWQERVTKVKAAMETTGLTLQELRDTAINKAAEMGITVESAFAAIADGTIATMQSATEAVQESATASTTAVAAAAAATQATVTATTTANAEAAATSVATSVAAAATGFEAIETTATGSIGRIQRAFDGADLTLDVGFDLGDFPGKPGDEGKGKIPGFARGGVVSGRRGQAQLAVVHGGETIVPPGGGGGGGSIIVPVNLDGREITKVVVRLTPEVRRKLGLM